VTGSAARPPLCLARRTPPRPHLPLTPLLCPMLGRISRPWPRPASCSAGRQHCRLAREIESRVETANSVCEHRLSTWKGRFSVSHRSQRRVRGLIYSPEPPEVPREQLGLCRHCRVPQEAALRRGKWLREIRLGCGCHPEETVTKHEHQRPGREGVQNTSLSGDRSRL